MTSTSLVSIAIRAAFDGDVTSADGSSGGSSSIPETESAGANCAGGASN